MTSAAERVIAHKSRMPWGFLALIFITLCVTFLISCLVIESDNRARTVCDARGGIYLERENECVPGFPQ